MNSKLKVGIIGCGSIAIGKHMPALAKLSSVEMVAFCDVEPNLARKAVLEYGVKDANIYQDFVELLQKETLDIVHICTPNNSHAQIAIAALEAGCHVMCEKPMAKTAIEARNMVDAAKRTGKKLSISYQSRFRSDSIHLKQLCERGDLGEIYLAKARAIRRRGVPTWGVFLDQEKQGGGPLIDIGTHALDLTLWLMDNYRPKYAVGSVYHKLNRHENAANAWGSWDPNKFKVEDSAFGFIVMENGATIILESSWALNTLFEGEARTILHGTKGGADMEDGLRVNGEEFGRLYTKKVTLESSCETGAEREMRLWVECIINDTVPLVLPEQAVVVTEILEAIYISAKSKNPVYFENGAILAE